MDYFWLADLIELAEISDAKGPKISTSHESIDFIGQHAQGKVLKNILIVGGGSCEEKFKCFFSSSLIVDEFAVFTCVDKFEPTYFNSFANSYSVKWMNMTLSVCSIPKFRHEFDAIICLGAGRNYMENCSQIYRDLIKLGSSGCLLILDFMIQAASLKTAVSHWHQYFLIIGL